MPVWAGWVRQLSARVAVLVLLTFSLIGSAAQLRQEKPPLPSASPTTKAAPSQQSVPRADTSADKSLIEKVAVQVGAVRGAIVDLVILIALGFFARAVIAEIRSELTIIDLIEVPKELAEQGYTPLVMAQRLHSEIAALFNANTARTAIDEGFEIGGSQIDFAVPSAGVSFRDLVRYVRRQIGRPERRLRGEIIWERETSLPSAGPTDGQLADGILGAAQEKRAPEETIRMMLRMSDGRSAKPTMSVNSLAELPELIQRAAFASAELADPYVVAAYWFGKEQNAGDFPKTIAAIRHCLSSTQAEKHDRAYFIWGNVLVAQREYDAAKEKYQRAIDLAPGKPRGYIGLGNLFRVMRRFDEAFAEYQKAAACSRKDVGALSSLGYICNDRHQYLPAVSYFQASLKLNPRHVNSLNGIAFSFFKLDRIAEAEAALSRAIDIDPRYGWPYRNLGWMLRSQRRYSEAIEYVKAAEGTSIAAEAYAIWGDILVEAGEFAAAADKYERSEQRKPKLAFRLGGDGFRFLRQHECLEAIRVSNLAIDRDKFYMPARLHKAEALRRLGRFDKAVDACREMVAYDHYMAGAYVNWGVAIQSKNPDEALALFQHATVKDPAETWAWRCWAEMLQKRYRYDEAISRYKRAIESDRFDSYSHLGWGRVLLSMGRDEEAGTHFQIACQHDGRNAAALRNVAEADIKAGRLAEACERFERAIVEWPRIAALSVQQGEMLAHRGFVAGGLACFERALAIDPRDPDALVGKASALRRLRRYYEAITLLRMAIDVEPTHHSAPRVLASTLRQSGEVLERALKPIESAHALDSSKTSVLIDWGNLLSEYGRHIDAARKFREAIQADRQETRPYVALGHALLKQHRPLEAIEQFRMAVTMDSFDPEPRMGTGLALEAMQRPHDALVHFRAAAELRPGESRFYAGWGAMLHRMGRLHDALDRYRYAFEIDRSNNDAFDRVLRMLFQLRRDDEALGEIERQTTGAPVIPAFFVVAGNAFRRLGRLSDARTMFRRALRTMPYDTNALIGFAETLSGRFDESACRVLEFVLIPDSSQSWPLQSLGYKLLRLGRAADVLTRFARAYEQRPDQLNSLIDASKLLVAMAERAARDADAARRSHDNVTVTAKEFTRESFYTQANGKLHDAANRNPWDGAIRRDMGSIYLATHREEDALAQFDLAVRIDRYDWAAYFGRAKAFFKLKKRREAVKAARRAASLRREDINALIEIAETLYVFEEPAEAIAVLKAASVIDRTDEKVIALQRRAEEKLAANRESQR